MMKTKSIILKGEKIRAKEIKIQYLDQEKIFKIKKGETKESIQKRLQNTIDKIAHLLKNKYIVKI